MICQVSELNYEVWMIH